jgi:hypothetical protein
VIKVTEDSKTQFLKAIHKLSGNSENEQHFITHYLNNPDKRIELFNKHISLDKEHEKYHLKPVKIDSYFLMSDSILQFHLYVGNILIREEYYSLNTIADDLVNLATKKTDIIYQLGGVTDADKERYYEIYSLFLPPNIYGNKLDDISEVLVQDLILNSPLDNGRYCIKNPGNKLAVYDYSKRYNEIDVQSFEAATEVELGYIMAGGGNLFEEPTNPHQLSIYLKKHFRGLFTTFHKPTTEALLSLATADEDPQHLENGYNYYMKKEDEMLITKAILDATVVCTDTK